MSNFALRVLRVTAGVPPDAQENFLDAIACLNRIMGQPKSGEPSQDVQHLVAFIKSYNEEQADV